MSLGDQDTAHQGIRRREDSAINVPFGPASETDDFEEGSLGPRLAVSGNPKDWQLLITLRAAVGMMDEAGMIDRHPVFGSGRRLELSSSGRFL